MVERTCGIDGCSRPHEARNMCMTHYVAARRNGLENLPRDPTWHYGSNPDYDALTLDCSVCGPGVPMKIVPTGGENERISCMVPYKTKRAARRAREDAAGMRRQHPTYKRRRRYGLEMGGVERLLEEAGGACRSAAKRSRSRQCI